MAALRDAGDLYIGTVRELMGHWEALADLHVVPQADGTTLLHNRSQVRLRGVSVAVRGGAWRIDGAEHHVRRFGADWILWCDLSPNEQVKVVRGDA